MTSLLGRMFGSRPIEPSPPMPGDIAYARAMSVSDEIIRKIDESNSKDPAIGVMADIWSQRRNVPFLTTVVEAVQEMTSPIKQRPDDLQTS